MTIWHHIWYHYADSWFCSSYVVMILGYLSTFDIMIWAYNIICKTLLSTLMSCLACLSSVWQPRKLLSSWLHTTFSSPPGPKFPNSLIREPVLWQNSHRDTSTAPESWMPFKSSWHVYIRHLDKFLLLTLLCTTHLMLDQLEHHLFCVCRCHKSQASHWLQAGAAGSRSNSGWGPGLCTWSQIFFYSRDQL